MKISIKFILTAAILLTATIFSFAQRGGDRNTDPEKRADRQTASMVESLSLNEKQAAEVKSINLSYAQKMIDARTANKGGDREAMKSLRDDLNKGRSAELSKVLTSEQLKTYEATKGDLRGNQRGELNGKRKGELKGDLNGKRKGTRNVDVEERAEKNTARMVEKLSLDQDQTARVKAINMDYAEKLKVANDSNRGDRTKMKSLRAELDKSKSMELEKVLTPEQFKTFTELKANETGKRRNRSGKRAKLKQG